VLARPALLPLRAHEVVRTVHAPALLFDPLGAAQPGDVHLDNAEVVSSSSLGRPLNCI